MSDARVSTAGTAIGITAGSLTEAVSHASEYRVAHGLVPALLVETRCPCQHVRPAGRALGYSVRSRACR